MVQIDNRTGKVNQKQDLFICESKNGLWGNEMCPPLLKQRYKKKKKKKKTQAKQLPVSCVSSFMTVVSICGHLSIIYISD